jgi:hypothetical protein
MKCQTCRKNDIELLTRWERLKNWFFYHLFSVDITDLSMGKYTQGFSDGYVKGREHERESRKVREISPEELKEFLKVEGYD